MDSLTKRETADRSKINMHQPHEVHYWTRHLNVSREDLQQAIDKVGNGAAAVRKQLATKQEKSRCRKREEAGMGFVKGALFWLASIPLPIVLLIALFMHPS